MSLNILLTPTAFDEYLLWQQEDKKTLKRINRLLLEMRRTPFTGTGKPEALVGDLSGWWARRIDAANRIVYRVDRGTLVIAQLHGHYNDK